MLRALISIISLQYGRVEAVPNKEHHKRAAKGKRPALESVEAKDERIEQRMSSEVTAKHQQQQDWAKRICSI